MSSGMALWGNCVPPYKRLPDSSEGQLLDNLTIILQAISAVVSASDTRTHWAGNLKLTFPLQLSEGYGIIFS